MGFIPTLSNHPFSPASATPSVLVSLTLFRYIKNVWAVRLNIIVDGFVPPTRIVYMEHVAGDRYFNSAIVTLLHNAIKIVLSQFIQEFDDFFLAFRSCNKWFCQIRFEGPIATCGILSKISTRNNCFKKMSLKITALVLILSSFFAQ